MVMILNHSISLE